jgi:hypothetical protein
LSQNGGRHGKDSGQSPVRSVCVRRRNAMH